MDVVGTAVVDAAIGWLVQSVLALAVSSLE